MRRVILTNGILLSDEELYALEKRYNNDIGFNYIWFLSEADPKDFGIPTVSFVYYTLLTSFFVSLSNKFVFLFFTD